MGTATHRRRRILLGSLATGCLGLLSGCGIGLPGSLGSSRPRLVGNLANGTADNYGPSLAAFRQGMHELGYIEGRDYSIETRYAGGRAERYPQLAEEIVENPVIKAALSRAFEAREKAATGIPTLKVGYNRVFGYYMEITNAHRDRVPKAWVRRQTLKNAERYITPELKGYEEKVLSAEEKIQQREYDLFVTLRDQVAAQTGRLLQTAEALATLDVLAGLHAAHELTGAEEEPLHLVHRDVSPHNIVVSTDGRARVRVIAGEALGARAVIDTHTPVVYQDWTLEIGADVSQLVCTGTVAHARWNCRSLVAPLLGMTKWLAI